MLKNLSQSEKIVYSQSSEDGMIEEILELLPDKDYWCCEFGANDGILISNTYNLIKNKNYSSVLIEGDSRVFKNLVHNFKDNEKAVLINTLVGYESDNNLNVILSKTPIPKNFDLISIDVDGDDYYIWDATTEYNPKIVIIEYNCTMPTGLNLVQPKKAFFGSSISAFVELASKKDYFLIATTTTNLIFVDNKYLHLFNLYEKDINKLRMNTDSVTYMFESYDGKIYTTGKNSLLWGNKDLGTFSFDDSLKKSKKI
jgi:hypothetical protein